MDKALLKDLFILTNKLKRMLDKKYQEHNIHTGQARVLMHLYRHKDEVTYQKDLENVFQIRGGTVTGMIDTLENYDYIRRLDSKIDKRRKQIVLTQSGEAIALLAIKTAQDMEGSMHDLLNKTEHTIFKSIFKKMNDWIDKEELNEQII